MQLILSALFIYFLIRFIRFLSHIRINKSKKDNQYIKNSYKNLDIQDADYEDIDQKL